MSLTHTNTTVSTSMLEAATSTSKALWQRFQQYRMYRKTLREMQGMSERELADFGLSRCQIDRIAHECVYGN